MSFLEKYDDIKLYICQEFAFVLGVPMRVRESYYSKRKPKYKKDNYVRNDEKRYRKLYNESRKRTVRFAVFLLSVILSLIYIF